MAFKTPGPLSNRPQMVDILLLEPRSNLQIRLMLTLSRLTRLEGCSGNRRLVEKGLASGCLFQQTKDSGYVIGGVTNSSGAVKKISTS